MKHIVIALVILSVVMLANSAATTTPGSVEVTRNIASTPLTFAANNGQWDQQVMFRANAGGATMWFTSEGATYQFTRTIPVGQEPCAPDIPIIGAPQSGRQTSRSAPDDVFGRHHQPDSIESIAIKASFIGANQDVPIKGIDALEYKCNYFIGSDPNKWHTDVPNYSAIVYEQVYDGIDLKYYGNGKQMEYDFIVSPGADFSQIQIQYEGAESISINTDGELVVTTAWGDVVEQHPVIYQMDNNSRITVAGEYRLKGDNTFGFALSGYYDPALPLVIDPLLSYSTYLGGSVDDVGYDIAVDGLGNAYVTGYTVSTDFPTSGAYQPDQLEYDVYVTKLSGSGNALVYSTYLGGNYDDFGDGIAVDSLGNAYVTGYTYSTDFPMAGAYQATSQGGYDAFVTKLNSTGNALVYSTYLGGSSGDYARSIVVDGLGNAYVAGWTESTDFPTVGAYQATNQGSADAFVTKLAPSGAALLFSTYVGGSSFELCTSIALDNSGNTYITGRTSSADFPTIGAYQTFQGSYDVFVTKLNSSGSALVYSTYLGGSNFDFGNGIAVDDLGNAYVTGGTGSSDFPTEGEYQTFQGQVDAIVTKLNSSGNALVYSTCLGGSYVDATEGIVVDSSGEVYLTGSTNSIDFPTVSAYQDTFLDTAQSDPGAADAFVTKLNGPGSALVYSTYLGGSDNDASWGIAVDNIGNAYVTGQTYSATDFPTLGAYQTVSQGNMDAFVTKFSYLCCVGVRGDVNSDGADLDIVDLTTVVDFLFGVTPPIPCPDESDVNGDGSGLPDIVDLTFIVDWLFGVAPTLVACP